MGSALLSGAVIEWFMKHYGVTDVAAKGALELFAKGMGQFPLELGQFSPDAQSEYLAAVKAAAEAPAEEVKVEEAPVEVAPVEEVKAEEAPVQGEDETVETVPVPEQEAVAPDAF